MKKRIVIALGGNALGDTLEEQMIAVKSTARAIVDLIEAGDEIIISHGNGPQVGMINSAMTEFHKTNMKYSICPMSVCVAMSQGYIGYDLQNSIREELLNRNINKGVATIITQVEVDERDKAFEYPIKPIGAFMTKKEADSIVKEGKKVIEDSGRGYRRVIASPKPIGIVEIDTIKTLIKNNQVVIACGGGGIPVVSQGNHLKGVGAVIDKDYASAVLAKEVNADCLVILTAVEKVAINFGKKNEQWLNEVNVKEMKVFLDKGYFAKGSMRPKVEAAIEFVESRKDRYSIITLLEKAKEGISGKTGTRIVNFNTEVNAE